MNQYDPMHVKIIVFGLFHNFIASNSEIQIRTENLVGRIKGFFFKQPSYLINIYVRMSVKASIMMPVN